MGTFYRGIGFPFRIGPTSIPARATDADLIRQSLIQLMGTSRGERVMRPSYGVNAINYIFENNNDLLAELIQADVYAAVGTFEPRVILTRVTVSSTDETVDVALHYVITATGSTGSAGVSFART